MNKRPEVGDRVILTDEATVHVGSDIIQYVPAYTRGSVKYHIADDDWAVGVGFDNNQTVEVNIRWLDSIIDDTIEE